MLVVSFGGEDLKLFWGKDVNARPLIVGLDLTTVSHQLLSTIPAIIHRIIRILLIH